MITFTKVSKKKTLLHKHLINSLGKAVCSAVHKTQRLPLQLTYRLFSLFLHFLIFNLSNQIKPCFHYYIEVTKLNSATKNTFYIINPGNWFFPQWFQCVCVYSNCLLVELHLGLLQSQRDLIFNSTASLLLVCRQRWFCMTGSNSVHLFSSRRPEGRWNKSYMSWWCCWKWLTWFGFGAPAQMKPKA